MSCINSITEKKILEMTKNQKEADKIYDYLTSDEFMSKFGEWGRVDKDGNWETINIDPLGNRTNAQGDPELFTEVKRDGKILYYFLDLNHNRIDITKRTMEYMNIEDRTSKINEVVNSISNNIFKDNIKKNFNDLSLIEAIKIEDYIDSFIKDMREKEANIIEDIEFAESLSDEELKEDGITRESLSLMKLGSTIKTEFLDSLNDNKSDIKIKINDFFRSKGLTINDITEQEEEEDDNSDRGEKENSVEQNSKDKASANVKLMLAFIPAYNMAKPYNKVTGEGGFNMATGEGRFVPARTGMFDSEKMIEGDIVHQKLLKELANIVTKESTEGVTDTYQNMRSIMLELSHNEPHYKDIVDMLDSVDEQKRTEFNSAMMHFENNHLVSEIDVKRGTFKTFNAAKQSTIQSKIIRNWEQAFNTKFRIEGKLQQSVIGKALDSIKNTIKRHNSIIADNNIATISDETYSSVLSRLISGEKTGTLHMLRALGLTNIDQNIIYSIISRVSEKPGSTEYRYKLISNINDININIERSLKRLDSKKNTKNYNFIKDNQSSLFNNIAETTAIYQNDVKDSTVYSMGKMFWVYGNPSYISNKVNLYKQNPKELERLKLNLINKHSIYSEYLLAEETDENGVYIYNEEDRKNESKRRLENFSVNRMLEFQEVNNSAEGVDNKKVSLVDQSVDRLNKVLLGGLKNAYTGELTGQFSPIYASIVPADKATSFEIKIGKFIADTVSSIKNGKIRFSDEILDIMYDYYTDEYNRMVKSFNDIKAFEALPENEKATAYKSLKMYYHVDPKFVDLENGKYGIRDDQNKLLGQSFKSQIFSEIDFKFLEPLLADSNIFNELNEPLYDINGLNDEIHRSTLRKTFNDMMNNRINENVNVLLDQRIISEQGKKYKTNVIDKQIRKSYNAEGNLLTEASMKSMISDYTLNTIIANIEYTKLFTGDPAYYKSMVDFFKRVPATYTDGIPLRLGMTEGDAYFNISTVEDQIIGSKVYDELENSLKLVNKDITQAEIDDIVGSYKKGMDQTDAQAWITPQRWKFILERTGKWSKAHNTVFDKMMETNKEPFTAKELKLSAQPVKGVYFGNGTEGPVYMKYSQAVLSPMLVKGTSLENLYDSMIKQNVDEAVTLQGIKVGANIPTDISGETIKFTKQRLNNADYKIQQDLPVKLMKQTLLGSQIQKNIYSTVTSDSVYTINDKTFKGTEIIDHINDILSKKSNNGIDSLSVLLGKDDNNVIDIDSMYDIIEDEILSNPDQYTNDVRDAVAKRIPFEAMPSLKDKLYSILFSKIRKAASNTKTNGGSFIQMSNYGLDKVTADEVGVTWLVKPEDLEKPSFEQQGLRPPTLYRTEDGEIRQRPGQIFISHSDIAKVIPNYRELAKEGKLKDMLDKDILKAIGYRIPNQGMSSNDALEIVGILPPHMNDTIVAYSEITTKTGSDFDIDKMYIMLPELKILYNNEDLYKAVNYLKANKYTREDYIDEIRISSNENSEFKRILANQEFYTDKDLAEIVAEELILNVSSNSELRLDFLSENNIGGVRKIVKQRSEETSDKGLNNMLFDAYWSILTHKDTYKDLIKPLDFDFLENHIKSLNVTKDVNENFKFYDGLYQLKLKNTYLLGKSGVGISANMAVDHNISKNGVNLTFNKYSLGVGFRLNNETVFDTNPETGTSMSEKITVKQAKEASKNIEEATGKKINYKTLMSFKIGDTISSFMNAFVDNAKDPYIEKGNYNTYTSDTAFMLVRAGVHPFYINNFMGQSIIKELSNFVNNYESISIEQDKEFKGMSAYDVMLYKQVGLMINSTNKVAIKKKINQIKNQEIIPAFTYDRLSEKYDQKDDYRHNVGMLLKFKEYQNQAKKLTNSVNLSRFDTLGSGKNYVDMMVYQNKLIEFLNKENQDKEIRNHKNKYIRNGKLTSQGTNLKNSVFYASDIIDANSNLFLSANKYLRNIIDDITMNTASSYGGSMGRATDPELISNISRNIYTSILSKFPIFQIEGSRKDLINSTKDRLIDLKKQMEEDEIKSPFINALTFYKNSFGIDIGNIPKNTKDNIGDSFYDLYKSNFPLALDVIRSAFFMNGFNQSLIDFNEMIPHEFFINFHKVGDNKYLSIKEFIGQELNNLTNSNYIASFHREYAQNNYLNNKIVPVISDDNIIKGGKNNSFYIGDKFAINSYMLNYELDSTNDIDRSTASFSRYIKTTQGRIDPNSMQFDNNGMPVVPYFNPRLLEYQGNMFKNNQWVPVYHEIEKRGYKSKDSKITMTEYGTETTEFFENKLADRSNKKMNTSGMEGFVHESKTVNYNSNKLIKDTNDLQYFIFNNDRNESEKVSVSEENVVSLQESDLNFETEQEAANYVEKNKVTSGTIINIKEEGYGKVKVRNEEEIEFIKVQNTIEELRQQEIQEFKDNGLNADDFITDGKIDINKVKESNNQKAKEIYDKYDKLISNKSTIFEELKEIKKDLLNQVSENNGYVLSKTDMDRANTYFNKSGALPKEFFTSDSVFKEFYNNETGKRGKMPQEAKWILKSNGLYDMIDMESGEVYIENLNLLTGKIDNNPLDCFGA